jgi:hypothetical protein
MKSNENPLILSKIKKNDVTRSYNETAKSAYS